MERTIRTHIHYEDSKLLFSQYIKMVQMLVIPEIGWKNVSSIKLNISDLIILGNEDPEKVYERINYALKQKMISNKQRAQRIYDYFMSAAIFPIIFFKNVYYPEKFHLHYKATARYRDLNRYLSDVENIPYIDHELYNYYYERGVNVYDKETLKRNCRVVTCVENKLY